MTKKLLKYLLIVFYVFAGINHFLNPRFYLGLIPDYLPIPQLINYLSGVLEITFGLGVIFSKTRKISCIGIIFLLIAFIPSHIYFIQIGSCVEEGLCVSPWISWLRLIVIHPLLIYWAWFVKG